MIPFSKALLFEMVDVARRHFPEWRRGQAFWNVAYALWPHLATPIGMSDPFYDDERVDAFLTLLTERSTNNEPPRSLQRP